MKGSKYSFEESNLSLILFADGANYVKSGNRSIWAIFSQIVELPPRLRNRPENIIFHSLWSGCEPNFSIFLREYNSEIDILISNGIDHNGTHYKIKCHNFVGDGPATSKICNHNQHNGYYPCLKCDIKGVHEGKMIFPYVKQIQLRNHDVQLKEMLKVGRTFKGIQGFSFLKV